MHCIGSRQTQLYDFIFRISHSDPLWETGLEILRTQKLVYATTIRSRKILKNNSEGVTIARYNCNAHCSVHLFIRAIGSHSYKERKQPQRIFLHYSCSVTMINIVKQYLSRKIHGLNTLIKTSDDS